MHTGALKALLTFFPFVRDPAHGDGAAVPGFDTVEDQRLGGLVMWGRPGRPAWPRAVLGARALGGGARPRVTVASARR